MIEYRWADTQIARMPALAADLIRRDVAVVVVVGDSDSGLQAVRAESATMPIVGIFSNPVTRGLISSLNRPGGNITGVNVLLNELGSKRLALLHELLPRAVTIAVLMNPTSPITEQEMTDVQTSARAIGLQIKTLDAANDHDLDAAFAKLARLQPDALLVTTNPLFFTRANQIVASVAHLEIPAMYFRRGFVDAGGLISYGSNADDNFRVAGDYTARILKGAKAGDLPVQQPTKYELIINLKTAKALGLTIPESFLLLADEVIE